MAFKDEELKFGEAAIKANVRNVPTEDQVIQRYTRQNTPNLFPSNVPSVEQMQGIEVSRLRPPLEVEFAADPAELARKRKERDIEARISQSDIDILNRDSSSWYSPDYKRAFNMVPDAEPMGFFGRAYSTLRFGMASASAKEDIIEEELGFIEEEKRRIRRTLQFGEFVFSFGQDIVKAATGGILFGLATPFVQGGRALTGDEDASRALRAQSDALWWKILYGRETERDIYGRVIEGTSKGREVRSVTALQEDYQKSLEEFQGIKPEDREFKDSIMPIMVSTFGAPAMMLLEMDIGILPIKSVSAGWRAFSASRVTLKGMLEGIDVVIKSAGKTLDAEALKEATKVAKSVIKQSNPVEAQKELNEFLLRIVGPDSNEGKAILGLEASVKAEVVAARTDLERLAISAPDLPTFNRMVEAAIQGNRIEQAKTLTRELQNVVQDPSFISATTRFDEIFREFGTGLTDLDLFKGNLVDSTPDAISKEFEALRAELTNVNDNTINRLVQQIAAVSPNVPIGTGAFDLTRNLLLDSKKTLPDLLEDVFKSQEGRTSVALKAANGEDVADLSGNIIVDTFQAVNKQIRQNRLNGRRGGSALDRTSAFLGAEDVARGAVSRRILAGGTEVTTETLIKASKKAGKVLKKTAKKAPKVAARKAKPVSPVNQSVFDNIGLSIGDTILQAAKDVIKAVSFKSFIKNSDEVMYQGKQNTQTFISDKKLSNQYNGNPEINPPVVLDMKQPMNLTGKLSETTGYTHTGQSLNGELSRLLIDKNNLARRASDGNPLTIEEAGEVMKAIQQMGYDGLIYLRREADGSIFEERMVVSSKQVIPAQFFYDNIKGGKEVFGDGIDLVARRLQQGEDILKKMLPKNKEYTKVTKLFRDAGLPLALARKASQEVHALMLNSYVKSFYKEPSFLISSDTFVYYKDSFVNIKMSTKGLSFSYEKTARTVMPDQVIMSLDDATKLYKQTADVFDADAAKRVERMAKVQIPGGITEAKFSALGPGHKAFNKALALGVAKGVFLPEEILLIRSVMKGVKDSLLKNIPVLKYDNIPGKLGYYRPGTNEIVLRRGLAYSGTSRSRRLIGSRPEFETGSLGSTTFFHEFGHLGHYSLLDKSQKAIVTKAYESMSELDLKKMFANSPAAGRKAEYFAKDEDEFFAQAFSDYVMSNKVVDEALVPLFERIVMQLKNAMKRMFSSKRNMESGDTDTLIPLFEQILKGQSSAKNAAKKKIDDAPIYDDLTSLDPGDAKYPERKMTLNQEAFDQNSKILRSVAGGTGIPKKIQKEALGISRQAPVTPPLTPKDVFQKGTDPKSTYDAKVLRGINKMDPANPGLAAALEPQKMFGKGTKVPRRLRQGQKQLASAMKKIQKALVGKDERFVKAVEALKAQNAAIKKVAKQRFDTAEDVKKGLAFSMRQMEEVLDAFGTGFSRSQAKDIAVMVSKTRTKKQLEKSLSRMADMVNDQLRIEARTRIGKTIANIEKGTRNIPPFWQTKIEERIGKESIRLKLFREKYEDRLVKLKKFLDENPGKEVEFKSAKTLRMLQDLEELEKRSIKDFDTVELMTLTKDIEKIYQQGEAAQFVIKGGKTKEISRQVENGVDENGKQLYKKVIIQKKGIDVIGLDELKVKADVAGIEDAGKAGDVSNLDSGKTMKGYGDLNAAGYGGIWDGIKNLAKGDKNAWNRGLMTYLTADRVVQLMDKMLPDGKIFKTMLKPMRAAVNKGERAGNLSRTRFLDKEAELIKKYSLVFGKESSELKHGRIATAGSKVLSSGFSEANYERIAIWAYTQQKMTKKLENVVPKPEIEAVTKGGLKPYEKEMYEFMRDELDQLYPKVDEVMKGVHGTRIERIKDYFPIQTNVLDSRTMEEVLNIEYIGAKRAVARGFTKERYDIANNMMKMNARDIYIKHMRDVSYFVEVEPVLKQVSGIARDEGFRKTMGDNAGQWWEQYLDIVARRGTPKNYDFNWTDTARKNMGAATLGYNLSPVAKQWLAGFAGLGVVGPKHTVLNGHGLMMREGLLDAIGDVSIEQALRAADDPVFAELRASGKVQKMQENGYKMIKSTDAWTARGIWLAAYSKQLEKAGKKLDVQNFKNGIGIDQKALEYADTVVRKTQGSGKFQDLPLLLTNKDKRMWTFMFQFQSFVLSQSQLVTHDAFYSLYAKARGKNKQTWKDVTGQAVGITSAVGFATYVEQQIARVITNAYGSEAANEFQAENNNVGSRVKEGIYSVFPPIGTAAGFVDSDLNTNVPVIDKILQGGTSIYRAFNADTSKLSGRETRAKEGTRFLAAAITLKFGIPGTSFAQQIIQNKGIEPAFLSPAENLKYAFEAGDEAEYQFLLKKYQNQGLNVTEIMKKSNRMIESDKRSLRKKDVDNIVDMWIAADTPKERNKVRRFVTKGMEDGTLTPQHMKEILSALKSKDKLQGLGEN